MQAGANGGNQFMARTGEAAQFRVKACLRQIAVKGHVLGIATTPTVVHFGWLTDGSDQITYAVLPAFLCFVLSTARWSSQAFVPPCDCVSLD